MEKYLGIIVIIGTILLAVDIIGTIHNFIMSRENRKLAKENAKRSKKNKKRLNPE